MPAPWYAMWPSEHDVRWTEDLNPGRMFVCVYCFVCRLFEGASKAHPEDSELQLALGVLHHLNRRYDAAIAAFQRALELRPGDYRWA